MTDSNTANICDKMALYSHGCIADAPDMEECVSAAQSILEILSDTFTDSIMEQDVQDMLWHMVNAFHRKAQTLENLLDANLLRQKTLSDQQDGSEINSAELETAIEEGQAIQTRLQVVEAMREGGAEQFTSITGSAWLPKSGSRAKGKALTASVIDSRDMRNARNLQKTTRLVPTGKRVAIAPGISTDHAKIWNVLDKVLNKTKSEDKDMVLLHGGGSNVEKIAARWAEHRNVPQVVFRPDWNKHGKAAPFKRNDALLEELPEGMVVIGDDDANGIPQGIRQQFIRSARALGILLYMQ